MTKQTYINKTNKLMKKALKYEDNINNYTLEELKQKCEILMIEACVLNKEYPEDTFYKEMQKAVDRILENKRKGVNWNERSINMLYKM